MFKKNIIKLFKFSAFALCLANKNKTEDNDSLDLQNHQEQNESIEEVLFDFSDSDTVESTISEEVSDYESHVTNEDNFDSRHELCTIENSAVPLHRTIKVENHLNDFNDENSKVNDELNEVNEFELYSNEDSSEDNLSKEDKKIKRRKLFRVMKSLSCISNVED